MGATKRLYEQMLEEQERKANIPLIDNQGYHYVNCTCSECTQFDDALAEAKGDELLASIIIETEEGA